MAAGPHLSEVSRSGERRRVAHTHRSWITGSRKSLWNSDPGFPPHPELFIAATASGSFDWRSVKYFGGKLEFEPRGGAARGRAENSSPGRRGFAGHVRYERTN